MDFQKIGYFIQKLRREKNMTQQELADFLHVTDRAVSHWENGRSIPDISLFQPLCEIFHISVNELICGERLPKERYIQKSDENIISTLNDHKRQKKRSRMIILILSVMIIILFLIALFGIHNDYPKIDLFHFTIQSNDEVYQLRKRVKMKGRNVYYYGLDFAVFCEENEICYSVDEALKHRQITLEEFQRYLEKQVEYENYESLHLYDGGTTIYQKKGIQVLYCHTTDGNYDVYIGNSQMLTNLRGEYCGHSRNPYESYIRTYKVLSSVIDENDSEFNFVTLEQNNGSVGTVLVSKSSSLVTGHTYEFSFVTFHSFPDTIENIFLNSTLLMVTETDKNTIEQVNEEIIVNKDIGSESELNELEHVHMSIVEGTLTRTSARIQITDFSGNVYSYDAWYRIDQRIGDEWVALPLKEDMLINLIAYKPDFNGYIELSLDWNRIYGKLDKGTYRIVKRALKDGEGCNEESCKEYYFSSVFEIN